MFHHHKSNLIASIHWSESQPQKNYYIMRRITYRGYEWLYTFQSLFLIINKIMEKGIESCKLLEDFEV